MEHVYAIKIGLEYYVNILFVQMVVMGMENAMKESVCVTMVGKEVNANNNTF